MPAKMEMAYYQRQPLHQLEILIEELHAYRATNSSPTARKWCDDFIEMLQTVVRSRSK